MQEKRAKVAHFSPVFTQNAAILTPEIKENPQPGRAKFLTWRLHRGDPKSLSNRALHGPNRPGTADRFSRAVIRIEAFSNLLPLNHEIRGFGLSGIEL
jgi:hypothetical protein